jgi:hypothetical protein
MAGIDISNGRASSVTEASPEARRGRRACQYRMEEHNRRGPYRHAPSGAIGGIGRSFALTLSMKIAAPLLFALILGACTQSENDKAREQARQTADQLKHDSREALHQAESGAAQAGREINRGLDKTRDKVREALNEHDHTDTRRSDKDNH